MAKRDHTPEGVTSKGKQERFLKVQYFLGTNQKASWIRLHGEWLKKAGFEPPARVCVRVVMDGCLLITRE